MLVPIWSWGYSQASSARALRQIAYKVLGCQWLLLLHHTLSPKLCPTCMASRSAMVTLQAYWTLIGRMILTKVLVVGVHCPGLHILSTISGEYVYVRPLYTSERNEAACGFSVLTTYQQDLNADDYSAGDGKDLYRYLCTHKRHDKSQVVTRIYLSSKQDGDGFTDDLNKDRGGRYFYLNWMYDKTTTDNRGMPWELHTHSSWQPIVSERDDLHPRIRRMLAEDCPETLPIEQIQFSQDSISSQFRNGSDIRDIINSMMNAPLNSRLAFINSFPPIRVVSLDGREGMVCLSLDNRRLHIMRCILPPDTAIPVRWATYNEAYELNWKWTATGTGMTIVVRDRRRNWLLGMPARTRSGPLATLVSPPKPPPHTRHTPTCRMDFPTCQHMFTRLVSSFDRNVAYLPLFIGCFSI